MPPRKGRRGRESEEVVYVKHRNLRSRIRDTKRILSRDNLPETVRQTKERVLKSLHQELDKEIEEKRCKKIYKKYRMVKFFEKKKVMRKLKGEVQMYDNSLPEERAGKEETIAKLRMELNYVTHFPKEFKYYSLYPSDETTSAKAIAKKHELLVHISESVASGELDDASLEVVSESPLLKSRPFVVADSMKSVVEEGSYCVVDKKPMMAKS